MIIIFDTILEEAAFKDILPDIINYKITSENNTTKFVLSLEEFEDRFEELSICDDAFGELGIKLYKPIYFKNRVDGSCDYYITRYEASENKELLLHNVITDNYMKLHLEFQDKMMKDTVQKAILENFYGDQSYTNIDDFPKIDFSWLDDYNLYLNINGLLPNHDYSIDISGSKTIWLARNVHIFNDEEVESIEDRFIFPYEGELLFLKYGSNEVTTSFFSSIQCLNLVITRILSNVKTLKYLSFRGDSLFFCPKRYG